jgi:phosphate transport system protein
VTLARAEDSWPVTREVDRLVIQLFARVSDAIAGATLALLRGDRAAAKVLVDGDAEIDALYREIERLVEGNLSANADFPQRLRYLIDVLRLLPELERSGDLAEHIARRGAVGLTAEMSARARGLIERMGEVASAMWRTSADAYGDGALDVGQRLEERDDEMDELHVTLMAELASGVMDIPVVIELTLVGRFYERLGDHAVNLAKRVPARAYQASDLVPPVALRAH